MRIFKHNIHGASVVLGIIELALLCLAALGAIAYLGSGYQDVVRHAMVLNIVLPVVGFASFYALGLYGKESIADPLRHVIRLVIATGLCIILASFLLGALFYGMTLSGESGVLSLAVQFRLVVLFGVLAFIAACLGRYIVFRILGRDVLKRRVLVLGTGMRASRIEALMGQAENKPFARIHFLPVVSEEVRTAADNTLPALSASNRPLAEIIETLGVDEVVVATDERRGLPIKDLLAVKLGGMRVTDYLTFYEREARRVDLDALEPSWFIFSDGFSASGWDLFGKRAFDVIVSVLFLLFTLPVTLIAAIVVKLDSPGPIFYRQERTGMLGRSFMLFKFRSMRTDAEKHGPQWAAQSDSRVTRVGAILRKTRIDEIPQIFCVLRGDMSFIGPRPERPFFVSSLAQDVPYYEERHRMKPGITGWAQVNYPYGASIADAKEKLSYDLYYTKNFSLFLDVLILLQTIRVVLIPDGAR